MIAVDGTASGSTATAPRQVGERLTLLAVPVSASGFVAIFDEINGTNRVVGFGLAEIIVVSATEVQISSRLPTGGLVAAENATATLGSISQDVMLLSVAEQAEILQKNIALDDVLLAPASVQDATD